MNTVLRVDKEDPSWSISLIFAGTCLKNLPIMGYIWLIISQSISGAQFKCYLLSMSRLSANVNDILDIIATEWTNCF